MTNAYNHKRSYDQRDKRYEELAAKALAPSNPYSSRPPAAAKYVVVCTRDGADGDFCDGFYDQRHYFTHRATAIAFAQHFSDINDHVAGVFKMPEFICRVDVR